MNPFDSLKNLDRWASLENPREGKWTDIRDRSQDVVGIIAREVLSHGFTVRMDGHGEPGDRQDALIIFHDDLTTVVEMKFTNNLMYIDKVPILATGDDAISRIVQAIVAEVERVRWRAIR